MSKSGKKSAPIVQHTGFGGASQLEENPVPVNEPDFVDYDSTELTHSPTYTDNSVDYGQITEDGAGQPISPKQVKRRRDRLHAPVLVVNGKKLSRAEARAFIADWQSALACKDRFSFAKETGAFISHYLDQHGEYPPKWVVNHLEQLAHYYPLSLQNETE